MVVWLGLRVRIQICIYHLTLILPCHHIMSSLQPPAKEELAQELLAFKHIEHYPASFEELPYRVRQITDNCLHQRQLYDNTVERRRLTRKYMNDLQELEAQLSMKFSSKLDSEESSMSQKNGDRWIKMSELSRRLLMASNLQYSEAPKQRNQFLQKIEEFDKEITGQIRINVGTFLGLKKKAEFAGSSFKYQTILEEDMWMIAESKFQKAEEAIRYIGKGLNSSDWWK